MEKYYTKISNITKLLERIYVNQGLECFLIELKNYCDLTINSGSDEPEEIGKRLASLSSILLSNLLKDKRENIMQYLIDISENLSKLKSNKQKISLVVNTFKTILEKKEEKINLFSEQILTHLKNCSLVDLKLITLDTLADKFKYSKHYLPKKFLEEQSYSIHKAIIYEKMNRAFQILSDPADNKSIKETALLIGFTDARYFSDLFKQTFGKTPSEIVKTKL